MVNHKAEDVTGGFSSAAEFWQRVAFALVRRHGDCTIDVRDLNPSGPNDDTLVVGFPGDGERMHMRIMGKAAAAHVYEQHKRDAGRRN